MPEHARTELDVERVAELANLPLDTDERERFEAACREVLDAFALPEVEPEVERSERSRLIEDVPEPWPQADVDAILDEVPRRDGRLIRG